MIHIEEGDYLDSKEVAQKLGIADSTLYIRSRAKEIPTPLSLPARIFWKLSDIEAYLREKQSKEERSM
ncbi:MAG: helix-turn-helix domain-containing protein [Holosporaceae bacterium]|jgi:predicted DNA-binding transcriptional regulator AlpA|nr:helix-turn-helix domain-containing protein [Holosporaceae bacterium]